MRDSYRSYYKVATRLLLFAAILLSIYIIIEYLIPFLLPFVAAFILALINEPLIRFLGRHTRFSRKMSAAISLIVTLSVIAVLVTLGILKIYGELVVLKDNAARYFETISNIYADWTKQISSIYNTLPTSITGAINDQLTGIGPQVSELASNAAKYIIDTASSVPKVVVFIIVTILSTYFMSAGRLEIRAFFYKQIPQKWVDRFRGVKRETFHSLAKYFKAILLLVSITFVEALIGLSILQVDYVVLMAMLIAISDAIPLFGTSIVYLPWIIVSLVTGNIRMVIGLGILWAIGFSIRQVLEPKIIGKQLGLHPLLTLMSIYVGLAIFGVIGVFVGPISLIIIKNLQTAGVFELWNE